MSRTPASLFASPLWRFPGPCFDTRVLGGGKSLVLRMRLLTDRPTYMEPRRGGGGGFFGSTVGLPLYNRPDHRQPGQGEFVNSGWRDEQLTVTCVHVCPHLCKSVCIYIYIYIHIYIYKHLCTHVNRSVGLHTYIYI